MERTLNKPCFLFSLTMGILISWVCAVSVQPDCRNHHCSQVGITSDAQELPPLLFMYLSPIQVLTIFFS